VVCHDRLGTTDLGRRVGLMESITMTTDAKRMSRVRSVCPEVGQILLAGTRGWVRGTTVPAAVATARVITDAPAPTFYVDGFGATELMDVAYLRTGEPPV
jgi:hypothetical protein